MKKLPLLLLLTLGFYACDTKKESIIDGQKMINKELIGLQDSLNRVGDTTSLNRIRANIKYLQYQFDSLGTELNKLNKKKQ